VDILTCDFETTYSDDYSLSKMQTDAYIMDPRFETILVSVMRNMERPIWFSGTHEETLDWLWGNFNWHECAVRAHHTHFDGFILTQRFGIRPKQWMCTLSQARMIEPHLPSHSLAALAKRHGFPDKGTAVVTAKGKQRADFNPVELAEYAAYCMHDTKLCAALAAKHYDPFTPALHSHLIDMTIRMFTEPALVGNAPLMDRLYRDEIARKEVLMQRIGADRSIVMSGEKLAQALRALGARVPMKVSPTTKRTTYAFAKTDKAFTDMLEHPHPEVQALVAARLGVKSTIAETRAKRFHETALRGALPVYLQFWGAKTTGRYSGGNSINWQNIPARGPSAGLREAICAPDGYDLVVGDSSNIELRMVMTLAGQDDVIAKIRAGVDLYCDFATHLFGRVITKADKAERQLGKTAMLSLQYGAGAERFQEMVRQDVMKYPGAGLQEIDLYRAQEIVALYRSLHHKVVELWNRCQKVILPNIAAGGDMLNVDVHGWFITLGRGFGRPGEPGVVYNDLQCDPRSGDWTYQMGRARVRIFGPKVVENLCQHAAMLVVMWQTARINTRYPVKLSVHDEAACVCRKEDTPAVKAWMEECLSLAPAWCRKELPVACEVGVGPNYMEAK
jgi:hypothetical protein